ncbi:MAG: sigma-70 family RNA polymerase sigma factor [Prevotella sp.]|nr:sigma-70 family RNA polymerase sigma factor [Prevotella sp.]MDY5257544.1 sigma-70 family RNA polymerase sigma factor [Prevotella sp.]
MKQSVGDDIISQCREGNQEAFRRLMGEHQSMVFSLALKMLANEQDAEDAVQDTFLRVWQRLDSYSPARGKFTTWLYAIASHVCLDRLKSKRHSQPLPGDEKVLRHYMATMNPYLHLENKNLASVIRVLVAGLSAKQRLVFTLRLLEGLPVSEIEAITGMTADKIKSNLYVARQRVKQQLSNLGYGKE